VRILAASTAHPIAKLGMEPDNLDKFLRIRPGAVRQFLWWGRRDRARRPRSTPAGATSNQPDVKVLDRGGSRAKSRRPACAGRGVMPKIGASTFEKALSSFLTSGPGHHMIGEMRDLEDASAAIRGVADRPPWCSRPCTRQPTPRRTITRLAGRGLVRTRSATRCRCAGAAPVRTLCGVQG